MVLELDVLEQELDAIKKERQEASERLRSLVPRGRGIARGRGRPSEFQGRGPLPLYEPAGRGQHLNGGPYGPRGRPRDLFPPGRPGAPRPGPMDRFGGPPDRMLDRFGGTPDRMTDGYGRPPHRFDKFGGPPGKPPGIMMDRMEPPPTRKRLMSAIVVGDEEVVPATMEDPQIAAEEVVAKRPAPAPTADDNPAEKKRSRRMFGALLGTLQKFKDEEAKFQGTTAAQKKEEAWKRAEDKVQAESRLLREEARSEHQQRRQVEMQKLRELNLKVDLKVVEVVYARKIKRQQGLVQFLVTKTGPPLHYMPVRHNKVTQMLADARQGEYDQWKEAQLQEMEVEKERLRAEAAAKSAAAGGNNGVREGAGAGTADTDMADAADVNGMEEQGELPAPRRPQIRSSVVVDRSRDEADGSDGDKGDAAEEDGEIPEDAAQQAAAEKQRLEDAAAAEVLAAEEGDIAHDVADVEDLLS